MARSFPLNAQGKWESEMYKKAENDNIHFNFLRHYQLPLPVFCFKNDHYKSKLSHNNLQIAALNSNVSQKRTISSVQHIPWFGNFRTVKETDKVLSTYIHNGTISPSLNLLKFFNSFFDNLCHEVVPGSWTNHTRSDLKGGGANPVP